MGIKQCVVTGAAGFIGSQVVRDLVDKGYDVIGLDNFSVGHRSNLLASERFRNIEVDITNREQVLESLTGVDGAAFIHLAAIHYIPFCLENPHKALRVNVEGTQNILDAADLANASSVVIASSAAVYGPSDTANKESDPTGPIEIYGLTKVFCEHLLGAFHRSTGTRCAAARLFNVYGPRETNPHVLPAILEQMKASDVVQLGNIEPRRDFVHVSDVSSGLLSLVESDNYSYELVNIGSGVEMSIEELVEAVSKSVGRKLTIKVEENRVREVERMHLLSSIDKIRRLTGWNPVVHIVDGLRELA